MMALESDYKGTLCVKCGDHGGYHKGDLCIRCAAAEAGEKCSKCGSPWVYIHAFMTEAKPRVPFCKPCCYAYIKLCGYADDLPILLKKMKDRWKAEQEAALKPEEPEVKKAEVPKDGQKSLTFKKS